MPLEWITSSTIKNWMERYINRKSPSFSPRPTLRCWKTENRFSCPKRWGAWIMKQNWWCAYANWAKAFHSVLHTVIMMPWPWVLTLPQENCSNGCGLKANHGTCARGLMERLLLDNGLTSPNSVTSKPYTSISTSMGKPCSRAARATCCSRWMKSLPISAGILPWRQATYYIQELLWEWVLCISMTTWPVG